MYSLAILQNVSRIWKTYLGVVLVFIQCGS
jgi:hypothetical protein